MATKKANPLGSLVPQTNRELVNLSYKMSMANVPKDLGTTFRAIGNSYERGTAALGKGISDAFKTAGDVYAKLKEENDQEESDTKTSKKFKNGNVGEKSTGVSTYGLTESSAYPGDFYREDDPDTDEDESVYYNKEEIVKPVKYTRKDLSGNEEEISVMNFEDHQKSIKAQKKEIRKKYKIGDPKRKELLENLKDKEERARESSILFSKTEIEIDQIITDGNLSENMTNSKKIQFLRAIKNNGELVDDGNGNKSRALMGFNKDGEIVFSYVDEKGMPIKDGSGNAITVSPGNAKSLVTQKDDDMRNKIKTVQNDYLTQGTSGTKITDAYSKKQQDNITGLITDKKKFNDVLGFKPDGFSQNFEQAVLGFTKSNKEISNMPEKILSSFPDNFVPDTDGVDGVSAGDFKTQENYKKLSNALLDSSDANFDLSRSAELVGEFMNSKFKVDGAGAYQGYLTNPDNAGEIERIKQANKVESTIPTSPTQTQTFYTDLSKSEGGRKAANRINTFSSIMDTESKNSGRITISVDAQQKTTSFLSIKKESEPEKGDGVLTMNYYNKNTGKTDKVEVTLEEAMQKVSGSSGANLNVMFGDVNAATLSKMFREPQEDKGFPGVPNNTYNATKLQAASNFALAYKDFTGLSIKAQGMKGSNVIFTFNGEEHKYNPSGDEETEMNNLKAFFKANDITKQ